MNVAWSRTGGAALASALVTLAGTASAATYDGRWALLQSTTTVAQVPIAGRIYATTVAVSLHDAAMTGSRLHGAGTLCSLELDSGTPFVTTVLPPPLRRTLPAPTIDADITVRDGKVRFWQASPTIVLGAKLARPDDPLPTDAEDPRVFDHDQDGAPGVTVRVDGIASGDIYVVQRSWSRLDGLWLVDGTFAGIVRHGVTQTVLDATSPFLESAPESVPVPTSSYFRLGRVGAQATCADAVRQSKAWSR